MMTLLPSATQGLICQFLGINNATQIRSDLSKGKFHIMPSPGTIVTTLNTKPIIVGFDVPILYTTDDKPSNRTVVLIGQDPLRNPKNKVLHNSQYVAPYVLSGQSYKYTDAIVGTPYAMHLTQNTNGAPTSYKNIPMYDAIVQGFLAKGYNVYLTDISKVYIKNVNSTSNDSFHILMKNSIYRANSIQLLCNEIAALGNVSNCIFFGKTAFMKIRKGILNCSHLAKISQYVVHPSDTHSGKGHWNVTYGISPINNSAKVAKILSLVP